MPLFIAIESTPTTPLDFYEFLRGVASPFALFLFLKLSNPCAELQYYIRRPHFGRFSVIGPRGATQWTFLAKVLLRFQPFVETNEMIRVTASSPDRWAVVSRVLCARTCCLVGHSTDSTHRVINIPLPHSDAMKPLDLDLHRIRINKSVLAVGFK